MYVCMYVLYSIRTVHIVTYPGVQLDLLVRIVYVLLVSLVQYHTVIPKSDTPCCVHKLQLESKY